MCRYGCSFIIDRDFNNFEKIVVISIGLYCNYQNPSDPLLDLGEIDFFPEFNLVVHKIIR